jgi:hypothetical protein
MIFVLVIIFHKNGNAKLDGEMKKILALIMKKYWNLHLSLKNYCKQQKVEIAPLLLK